MSILEGTGTGMGGMRPSADDDDAQRVTYELTCSDFPDDLEVRSLDAIEELNRPYVVAVQVELRSEVTELGELLGRDAVVRLHRRDHERSFAGIVGRTRVEATGHWGPIGTIEIVPALWALRFTEQSRIFQEKTALEIVELILNESLGKYGRGIDTASIDRHWNDKLWLQPPPPGRARQRTPPKGLKCGIRLERVDSAVQSNLHILVL